MESFLFFFFLFLLFFKHDPNQRSTVIRKFAGLKRKSISSFTFPVLSKTLYCEQWNFQLHYSHSTLDIAQTSNLLTNANFIIHSDIFKITQRIPVTYLSSLWLGWCVCLYGVANLQLNHRTDFRNKKPPMIKLLLKLFTIRVSVNSNLLVFWITVYYTQFHIVIQDVPTMVSVGSV